MNEKTLIVIVGPTAIGKTELAIKIAQKFRTEIISADSRQFYRELSIGTAKPTADELSAAPHHFINSRSIFDNYTVGDYEGEALALIERLFLKHDQLVLVGGSGLFVKAVTEGFDNLPKATPELREELNNRLQLEGIESLQGELKQYDPEYYKIVDLANPQRIIRALEVYHTSGHPISSFRLNGLKPRPFKMVKIGLNTDREVLYQRINLRVDKMLELGLIEEVKSLSAHRHLNALNTVGYSEIFDYLDDTITAQEASENIKQNTRRFAKRQLTWFRKDESTKWFRPGETENILAYLLEKMKS